MLKTKGILSVVLFFVLSTFATATDFEVPSQTLSGHLAPVETGDLVELSITPIKEDVKKLNLSGVSYQWRVFEFNGSEIKDKRFRQDTSDNGRAIFFGAGNKDKKFYVECYVTYLYVVKTNNVITEVGTRNQLFSGVVTVGSPEPIPVPPDPKPPTPIPTPSFPDGKYKLSKFVFETAIVKVDKANREKAATAISHSFLNIINDIDAKKIIDPKTILVKTSESNRKALLDVGVDGKIWDAFFVALQDNIYDKYERFEMKDAADFRTAWAEIAVGLSQVK